MLLVAYLDRRSVRNRPLSADDRSLLAPMIRRSDNAADRVLGIVGPGGLRALARRAGMRRFTPVTGIWGLSRIDAADQALPAPDRRAHRAAPPRLRHAAVNTITPRSAGGSHASSPRAGGCTSRAVGAPAPAGSTTRSRS